ncbi:MAG: arsenosugar biosynthesis-associated peroxidase-like protein, partial [Myxococcota bacterium]
DRRHLAAFSEIGTGQPDLARLFFSWYGAVFADGALSPREKSLAALAVAHVVQCPYCIDAYTKGSLEAGADLEQLTEAVHVAAAVRAGSTLMYGMQAMAQAAELELGEPPAEKVAAYFDRSHVDGRREGGEASPALTEGELGWETAAFGEGALDLRAKSAIAVASAHALQCAYSIDRAVRVAREADLDLTAITEAVHVAAAIRGGASLVHGIQMLEQVREEEKS